MELNNILLIGNATFFLINAGITYYVTTINKEITKPKSIAYLIDPKTSKVTKEINITKKGSKTFRVNNKTYNILIDNGIIKGKLTKYYYVEGRADSINLFNKENSRIPSDVLDALLNENLTKKLNDYVAGLPFNLEMKHVIIGLGILVGIGVYFFGS